MTIPNENRKGFKQTPVGWIPNDWEYKRIKSLTKVIAGGTPRTSEASYWNGNIRWMNSGELNLKKVYDVAGRITKEGFASSSTQLLPPSSVLIGLAGQGKTRGTVAINMVELCTNQSVAAILPSDQFYSFYLYHNLDFRYNELRKLSTGDGGRGGLNLKLVSNLLVLLPPLPEQKAIATILSTWDKAIETTQKLIAQKEICISALMQKLITGKSRLKGLENKWNRVPISEIATEIAIRNDNDDQLVVLSCTKYDGLVPSLEYFGRKIFSDDLSTYKIVPKNTFAYATNHIEEGSIGYQRSYDKALISPMYTVFKTHAGINNEYLYRVLKSYNCIHEYQKRMEGSIDRRGGLRWDEFSKIKLWLPSEDEQTAITKVLQTADNEIELIRQNIDALKLQKKGLMQKLLTGQIRVKT